MPPTGIGSTTQERLLVVEDEDVIRELVTFRLGRAGFLVREAATAAAARGGERGDRSGPLYAIHRSLSTPLSKSYRMNPFVIGCSHHGCASSPASPNEEVVPWVL
jgi:hypothetical protein